MYSLKYVHIYIYIDFYTAAYRATTVLIKQQNICIHHAFAYCVTYWSVCPATKSCLMSPIGWPEHRWLKERVAVYSQLGSQSKKAKAWICLRLMLARFFKRVELKDNMTCGSQSRGFVGNMAQTHVDMPFLFVTSQSHLAVLGYFWVNYYDLTATSLEIMV